MASKTDIVEKVVAGVNSWNDFYKNLLSLANQDKDTYADTVGRGMEQFAKLYFQVKYSRRYTDVLLYDEIPHALKKALKLPKKDFGVDLLFKDFMGKYTACQSKFRSREYVNLNWGKDELSHLLASGNNCDNFCVFSNASDLAKEVKNKMHEKSGSFYVLNDELKKTDSKFWDAIRLKIEQGVVAPKTALSYESSRQDQKDCVKAIEDSIKAGEDRGHISVFCGVGKTAISMWVNQRNMDSGLTLFLAPSIALAGQTRSSWCVDDALCVCSDADTNDSNKKDVEQLSIGAGVTTNVDEIKAYVGKNPNGIIFCTYHSSKLLIEALKNTKIKFAVMDECHRTATGINSTHSIILHNKDGFRIDYRLFMTATVKILAANIKSRISNNELPPVFSMDNEADYGKRLFSLNLREAINLKIVTDYRIKVFGVTNSDIKNNIVMRKYLKPSKNGKNKYVKDGKQISYNMMANVLGVAEYIKKSPKIHAIVYHNGIKESVLFKDLINEVLGFACAEHVDGKMSIKERTGIVEEFKSKPCAILTNDSVLKEGIDIPKVDIVVFCANKKSRIDIVQSMGRAVRRDWDNDNKIAAIVIPMYVTRKRVTDKMIESSPWKTMIFLLKALGEIDYTVKALITKISVAKGRAANLVTKELEEVLKIGNIDFNDNKFLKNFFISDITDRVKDSWEYWYTMLMEYKKEHGDCNVSDNNSPFGTWVANQRQKKDALSKDRLEKLNKLQFSWNPNDDGWNESYVLLLKYKDKHGDCNIPSSSRNGLSRWVSTQREFYKQNRLTNERVEKLNKIGFFWDLLEKSWEDNFDKLTLYKKEHGHCNVVNKNNKNLASWVYKQRANKNTLSEEKLNKLNAIGFNWNPPSRWELTYQKLTIYYKENGNCLVPPNRKDLAWWVTKQRKYKSNLTNEQINKLNKLHFVWGNGLDHKWDSNYLELEKYHKKHGHCLIPAKTNGQLGSWVCSQRAKRNKLSKDRIEKLNKLGFEWNPIEARWNEMFDSYKNNRNALVHKSALWSWAHTQRYFYKKGKLTKERVEKLKKIKFNWTN